MLKRSMVVVACACFLLLCGIVTGCGSSNSASQDTSAAPDAVAETSSGVQSDAVAETSADTPNDAVLATESLGLEDGVYEAEFNTDSSMFHINEVYDGKGTLTVVDGSGTIHITLVSKRIVNLYQGTSDQAKADEAGWLQPTSDSVTYSDGYTETVYGFDVAVPVIDQEFDLAILGSKGKWYDHKVSVSDPQPIE